MRSTGDLTGVSTAELMALRERIALGNIGMPLTLAGLQAAGLGGKPWILSCLSGMNQQGALVVLDLVLAERQVRQQPRLDLVWTGPEAVASTARDTRVVMGELFSMAREQVLIAGYAFDSGEDLFEALHRGMVVHPLCVQVFLNIDRAPQGVEPAKHARGFVQRFLLDNWPWLDRFPEFFYDPRTTDPGSMRSLHAKCVVVDERLTLIGSANFTGRGQTRNIEMGVLVESESFGRQVALQWKGLINLGLVRRILP